LAYSFSMVSLLIASLTTYSFFPEHGHSHENHGDNKEPDHSSHEHTHEEYGTGPVGSMQDTVGGDERERSNSLYGHPAATRASLVQVAHELQLTRSPSSSSHAHSRYASYSKQENMGQIQDSEQEVHPENEELGPERESTPLLRNHSRSPPQRADENLQTSSKPSSGKSDKKHNHSHHDGSMNMRALVLHVLGDALGNIGVIATGLIIWLTTLSWKFYFDPIISLVITVIIFSSALPLGISFPFPLSSNLIDMPSFSEKRVVHSSPGRAF
jgi:solute carrier family 30 (zinc transporter), member 1